MQHSAAAREPIRVSAPLLETGPEGWRLSATLAFDDQNWEIFFRSSDTELAHAVEPFLELALPAAMAHDRALVVEGPVSPQLLAQLPELQRLWNKRVPSMQTVEVVAPARTDAPAPASPGTVLLFSGGVDSFFSLLEHEAELTALVFVDGFDIHPHQRELHAQVWSRLAAAAASFDKPLIRVETNLREFADALGDWGMHFYGAACAAVAQALAPAVGRCYISGEKQGADSRDGSRPELDPLWSTETVEFRHFGQNFSRLQKLERICPDPRVRAHLRVCWENRSGRYNCGECSKCLRNMAALRAIGWLDQVSTFDRPLSLEALEKRVPLAASLGLRGSVQEIVEYLRDRDTDPDLRHSLERALARAERELRHPGMYRALKLVQAFPARVRRKLDRLLQSAANPDR